ncbi:MAG: polysaccharide deacetylase family protein [Lachnospiraceae bacterium]|nr:polysaccharide deacetylase family protein [Lachnospiraceae bacterium]
MAAGQAKEIESSIEVIDFNEYNTVSEQETEEQEPTTQETETVQEDAVKKQPPEDFELKFDSEEWGLSFGEPGMQSVGNASAEDLAWYDAYYVGDDSEKIIYLTFDCGYENGNTEPILDALKKHNVQATFFVVGHFLETAPDLTKRMVEEGHTVGNHTYHHPDMSVISDQESFQKELDDVADLFYEITGTKLSKYYRPPQGKCNAENVKMAQEIGYSTIFWSLAYVDWDAEKQPSHEEAFDKLTTRIHPGAIVLLHNTSQTNGEILDELLTKWEDMGYIFKPLSDLTLH